MSKREKDFSKPLIKPHHEDFCQLFAGDKEFLGNGVQSYIEAFDPDISKPNWYKTARVQAHNLLTTININGRINFLIETDLNDLQVDKQLSHLVAQNAELNTKLGAIKEYNALKARVVKRAEISGKDGGPIPLTIVNFGSVKKNDNPE